MLEKKKNVKDNLPALFLNRMREISVSANGFLFTAITLLGLGLKVAHRLCFCLVLSQFCKWLFWRYLKC